MAAVAMPLVAWDKYLEIERAASGGKSEYFEGRMVAMSGGTYPHARLGTRLSRILDTALDGRDCTPVNSELRVAVTPQGPFFYPDASIQCGSPALSDHYRDTLLNPVVIFEILSKSTESFDRGFKFRQYRRIGTLQAYVLISQWEPCVEVFGKGPDGKWSLTEYYGLDAVCDLGAVDLKLPLSELYRGIPLAPMETLPADAG